MQSKAKRAILTAGLIAAAAWTGSIGAQEAEAGKTVPSMLDRLGISQSVETYIPGLDGAQSTVSWTLGGTFQLAYSIFPKVDLLGRVGVQALQMRTNESLLYIGGSAGVGYSFSFADRFSIRASAFGGLGQIPDTNTTDNETNSYGMYELGARLVADMRISSAFILGLSVGFQRLATPSFNFIDALSTGIVLRLLPSELGNDGASVTLLKIDTQTIFPVLRSWYGNEPLGTVEIRNDEDGPIRDIKVSFYAPEYMGSPRIGGELPLLRPGETATVPLYAIFDERVLQLTQNVRTSGEIAVEYRFYGTRRIHSEAIEVRLHHRNAMTWEDDRKAAAFVSPTDPAALWFSRYASSIVRDRMRADLPANLQYALGIFEALRLHGVNYVIDPNSAYVEMASNAASVDYLQYPGETLMYRGGDCDDLSILFCSLLESAGISTAFITIPGHIYMAFDVGITEQQATEQFFDPGLLFIKDGKVWAPIEITMVREGFVKAWRIGAKQWLDNNASGTADLFPMRSNWLRYPSTGIQDAAARFELPAESDSMVAFDDAVDRFIIRELGPSMQHYETELTTNRSPEVLNAYGIVLAKAGLLDQAWERFTEAAEQEYGWSWNNLANIAFARKDYELAYSYYDWAESLLPEDPVAVMGKARAAYELDRYSESAVLYESITASAPLLTDRFAYLASVFTGTGRAFSLADRLSGTIWSQPGLSFLRPFEFEAAPAPALVETPEVEAPEEIITEAAELVLVPVPPEPEPEPEPEP
ncbi:MAG: hypothetical protein KKC64_13565, partial [Spirochaetes bacterium]|nr:hypothetical protein [Spirochaetota bacterium]